MKKRLVVVFAALIISIFAFSLSFASALPTAKEISSALDISSSSIVNVQLEASNSEGYGAAIFTAKDFPAEGSNLTKFPFPVKGKNFLVLSSGDAYVANNYKNYQYSEYDYNYNGSYESGSINDLTQLVLTVKVPENAESFKFDFIFCSQEWPDYYMSEFNDAFVAERDSSNFFLNQIKDEYGFVTQAILVAPNDFALDPKGNPLNINSGYGFDPDNKYPDTGTGYGGCTVPLTASAKITNKEQQIVILSIFDASDNVLDSAVLVDNFRFSSETGEGIDICGEECETQQPEAKEGGNIKLIFGIILIIIAFAVIFIYAIFFKKKKDSESKKRQLK